MTTPANEQGRLTQWERQYMQEYLRETGFQPYMSTRGNKTIKTFKKLIEGGEELRIPLIPAFAGAGVGTNALVGAEEVGRDLWHNSRPVWRRNAFLLRKSEQVRSALDLKAAHRENLKNWSSDDLKWGLVEAFQSVAHDPTRLNEGTGVGQSMPLASASAAQRNAFINGNNVQRVLFGAAVSNLVANDWAASLLNVDATADRLTAATVRLAKRQAQINVRGTRPAIRPIRIDNSQGREYYVMFVNSLQMRDLKNDLDVREANRHARYKDLEDNPIFQGGDEMVDGVIIREIPEFPVYTTAGLTGAAGVPTGMAVLCGAEAIGIAWGQMTRTTRRAEDDYEFLTGIGTEELRAVEKLWYDGRTHGAYHVITACPAD